MSVDLAALAALAELFVPAPRTRVTRRATFPVPEGWRVSSVLSPVEANAIAKAGRTGKDVTVEDSTVNRRTWVRVLTDPEEIAAYRGNLQLLRQPIV